MVLVSYQKRELGLETFHYVGTSAARVFFFQFDTPVDKHTFYQKVQADQELDCLLFLLQRVQSLCERIHLENLTWQLV